MKPRLIQSIQIQLTPSIPLLGVLSAVSIASCLILSQLSVPLSPKIGLGSLVVFSSVYFICQDALLLLPWSWRHLEINHSGKLTLTNKRGQQFTPTLANNSVVTHYVIVLNMKKNTLEWWLPPVILLGKRSASYRQLRVYLRWWRHQALDESDGFDESAA